MPQPTQHSLVYILLLWTTIISIIQVVLTILFFTTGHNGLSQNSSAEEPERVFQTPNSTLSPSTKDVLQLGPGKMLTFTAEGITEGRSVKWITKSSRAGVISKEGEALEIYKDGFYFLNLQVSSCKSSNNSERSVKLWNKDKQKKRGPKVLLEGWINTKTNTTGILSKVEVMSADVELEVTIDPPVKCINTNESATHLDIIFICRPRYC